MLRGTRTSHVALAAIVALLAALAPAAAAAPAVSHERGGAATVLWEAAWSWIAGWLELDGGSLAAAPQEQACAGEGCAKEGPSIGPSGGACTEGGPLIDPSGGACTEEGPVIDPWG